ncbi:hypothetical protein Tco_0366632 [Tanacetum coccineum]
MDDEPMWAADRVVAPTLCFTITIPETVNKFAIKGNRLTLVKGNQFDGSGNSDSDKIMVRMDAMTMKIDAQYKEMQSRSNHLIHEYDEDDKPMSPEEEAKFIQTFRRMPNVGKFLKELVSNKHKLEQISSAFLSDESSAIIQNKVSPKLRDPGSFLIPCTFSKAFSCNALADLGASIDLMPYSLYAKLSLETLKPTKINVSIEVIDEILEADFDSLLDEDSKILHSIEGTILEEKLFAEFDEFMAMNIEENS